MFRRDNNENGHASDLKGKAAYSPWRKPPIVETRLLHGYIHAVNSAALAFTFLFGVKMLVEGASKSIPFPARIWSFAVPVLVLGGIFWLVAFFTAFLPVALVYAFAGRFKIHHLLYYLACGALTGFALTPAYVLIGPQQSWQNDQSFSEDCITWAPIFVICGICGAIAFWHKLGRHIGTLHAKILTRRP